MINFSRHSDRYFSDLDSSSKLFVGRWLNIFKCVNHISDHGFKCFSGSLISTDKQEFAMKFRFASVLNNDMFYGSDSYYQLSIKQFNCQLLIPFYNSLVY